MFRSLLCDDTFIRYGIIDKKTGNITQIVVNKHNEGKNLVTNKFITWDINSGRGRDSINMENVSDAEKLESKKSLQSTISKSQKALEQMIQKGANTSLVQKRLKALCIGLALLENAWEQKPYHYTQQDLAEARNILAGLFPSIENIYAKSKAGSPQKTLLKRRIKALELAVQTIDDLLMS